jgi:hypothetical protein
MVLKLGQFEKWIVNSLEVVKCRIAEGWSREFGLIV